MFFCFFFFPTAPLNFEPNTLLDAPLLKDLFVSGTKTTQWTTVPVMLRRGSAGSLTQIKKEININKLGKKKHPKGQVASVLLGSCDSSRILNIHLLFS